MIAYLRGDLVVFVGDPPPLYLTFDSVMPNAVNPVVGKVWNGSAFVAPVASSEPANLATLAAQADAAIAANITAIANANAWLAANTGASLTTTVLTTAVKSMMNQQIAAAQQRNGIIRLLRGKLDATT